MPPAIRPWPDREQVITRLDRALAKFRMAGPGVCTTRDAIRDVLADPMFQAGLHTTTFLQARELPRRT